MLSFTSSISPPSNEKSSPWGLSERYLNISRKPYQATCNKEHTYSLVRKETASQSWGSIVLKLVSYCTIFPALIFLGIRTYCRRQRVFNVGDETPASAKTSEVAQTTITAINAPSSAEPPIVCTQTNIVTETDGLPKPEVGDTPTRQGEEAPTPNALTAPLDKGANEPVSQNLQQTAPISCLRHNMPTDKSLMQLSKRLLNYKRLASSTEVCRPFHIDDRDFSVTISPVGETRCCFKIQDEASSELFTVEMDADARNQSFTEHGVQVAGLAEEHLALLNKIIETSLPNAFGTIVSFVQDLIQEKDNKQSIKIRIRESVRPTDELFKESPLLLSYVAEQNELIVASKWHGSIRIQLNEYKQPQSIIRSGTNQTIEDPLFTSILEAIEDRIASMMDPLINDLPLVDIKNYGMIRVKTRQKSPENYPWIHLERLYTSVLDVKAKPQLNMKLLGSTVLDDGGPSKTYLTTLFFELCKQLVEGSTACLTNMWAPMTLPTQAEQKEEKRVLMQKRYRQMGAIMMWCYRSLPGKKMLMFGNRFHPGLFNAVLSLTEEELTAQILSPETKRKIREIVFQANADNQTPAFQYLQHLKNTILSRENVFDEFKEFRAQKHALEQRMSSLSPLEKERLKNLRNKLEALPFFCEEYSLLGENSFDPENSDDNVLKNQLSTIYKAIKSDDFSDGSLCSDMVSAFCACEGILGIAQGMRDLLNPGVQWDRFRQSVNYETISTKIQGSMARQDVARFTVQNDPENLLQDKVRFLTEWILDSEHTSDEEIRHFLLWITGTDGITTGGIKLKLVPQISGELEPFDAYTCFSQLDIAERFRWNEDADPTRKTWDWNTKEGFLAWLKDYSKKGAAAYTTK